VEAAKTAKLEHLLRQNEIWRGTDRRQADDAVLDTGFAELDELIGGGWPRGARYWPGLVTSLPGWHGLIHLICRMLPGYRHWA